MNLLRFLLIVLAFGTVCPCTLSAQETVFGMLIEHVSDLVDEMPGSSGNQYKNPTSAQVDSFKMAFHLMREGDLAAANSTAGSIDYKIVRFIDHTLSGNQEFIILERQQGGSNYWGTVIFNPQPCRPIVIQCPHPRLDSNTGLQGAYIFTRIDATAMMLSGTHRCNSSTSSNCSGTTTVCGSSAKYRISDVAHNHLCMFQEITKVLSVPDPDAGELTMIQLHGFAKQSGDPNLIMSNGTRDTPLFDPIAALRNSLQDIDPSLEFKIAHIHTEWTRLTGFTNTQGRFINNSPDACSANASNSEGYFMHIEQEFDRFRENEEGWDLMYRGLADAFPCGPSATAETPGPGYQIAGHHIAFDVDPSGQYILEIYTTDGRCLHKVNTYPNVWHELPRDIIPVVVLRSAETGAPVFRKLFFFTD